MPDTGRSLFALLQAKPGELADLALTTPVADIAEALHTLTPDEATAVICALPFDVAVGVFDHPELEGHRAAVAERMPTEIAARLISAMSADEQADLFREIQPDVRPRLLARLDPATREALAFLLGFPPDTAGGIMTTEFVAVPATGPSSRCSPTWARWRARRRRSTPSTSWIRRRAARARRVAARAAHGERDALINAVAPKRRLITVAPLESRTEAARLIGKYNLLALPVVDETRRLLGIVTVDDVIDAMVAEQTEPCSGWAAWRRWTRRTSRSASGR